MSEPHTQHASDPTTDLTRNQGMVFKALVAARSPLSAYDLLDQLRAEGLKAPLQIYRALDALVDRGLAHRLESLNSFVACSDAEGHDHGTMTFVICDGCGKVEEFADKRISAGIAEWTRQNDFKVERTAIEIRGRCAECRKAA